MTAWDREQGSYGGNGRNKDRRPARGRSLVTPRAGRGEKQCQVGTGRALLRLCGAGGAAAVSLVSFSEPGRWWAPGWGPLSRGGAVQPSGGRWSPGHSAFRVVRPAWKPLPRLHLFFSWAIAEPEVSRDV